MTNKSFVFVITKFWPENTKVNFIFYIFIYILYFKFYIRSFWKRRWGTGTDGIHDFIRFVVGKGDFCAKNSEGENFENRNFAILAAPKSRFWKVAICSEVFQKTEKSFWKMLKKSVKNRKKTERRRQVQGLAEEGIRRRASSEK